MNGGPARGVTRDDAFLPYPATPVLSAYSGPLAGLSLAVKDIFDVAGYPTGSGNAFELAASGIKTKTAPLVQSLLDAGARFVGKTHTDELAYSLLGRNIHFGAPGSASFPGIIAGGSSTGSALAVAGGLADIGLGTDTSGSIRIPAALNGCIGWRPSWGLLPLDGCRQLAPSFDTAGFLVRSFEVLDQLAQVLGVAGTQAPFARMVVPEEMLEACDAEIAQDFQRGVGAMAVPVRMLGGLRLSELTEAFQTILWHEAAASNRDLLRRGPDSIDPQIRLRLERGRRITAAELAEARHLRAHLSDGIVARLKAGGVAIFPTLPTAPPCVDAPQTDMDGFRQRIISLTCLSGLTSWPQVSLPQDGTAPTRSISLLSPWGTDRRLLAFASRLAASTQKKR